MPADKKSKNNGGAMAEATSVPPQSVPAAIPKSTSSDDSSNLLGNLVYYSIIGAAVYYISTCAYEIRLNAIKEFGPVIHEFDPYFNWRATEVSLFHNFENKSNI